MTFFFLKRLKNLFPFQFAMRAGNRTYHPGEQSSPSSVQVVSGGHNNKVFNVFYDLLSSNALPLYYRVGSVRTEAAREH